MKLRLGYLIGAFISLSVNNVSAVEALSAKELASHCIHYAKDNLSVDGEFCARYIQGFIDGAVITDARVMINVEENLKNRSSLAERATRTRAPGRDEYRRAARFAEYCLGDPVPLKEVVTHVVSALGKQSDDIDETLSARDVVYATLKAQYPCTANPN